MVIGVDTGSPRVPALVDRLQGEAGRLARMVRDLLDLRRLEDPGEREFVPVDLAAILRAVVAEQQPAAEAAEVTTSVEAPDHAYLGGVPSDLRLVVANLVTNAIRYNRPGGSVTVRLTSEPGAEHVVEVVDTGIGIPQQALQRIFERFYRVDVARSRDAGGTGLGLSIVRHAVERHGGTVTAASLLGSGSTFTVRLPVTTGT